MQGRDTWPKVSPESDETCSMQTYSAAGLEKKLRMNPPNPSEAE